MVIHFQSIDPDLQMTPNPNLGIKSSYFIWCCVLYESLITIDSSTVVSYNFWPIKYNKKAPAK